MSVGASPVVVLTEVIKDVLAVPAAPLAPTATLLGRSLAEVDPVRLAAELQDLAADAALTAAARNHDDLCDALKAWGRDLVDLAELVLAPLLPVAAAGEDLLEVVVIGLLRLQYPRLAAVLDAAGVFDDEPMLGSRFNWDKLRDFVLTTSDVVSEAFWDEMFGDSLIDLDVTGRMPAVLVALLICAPQAIAALGRGDLRIAGLEPPPVPAGASPEWKQLRERSAGWVAITHPLVTRDGELERAAITDLAAGFVPEQTMSLLIRSRRRPGGGRTVTDFEIWLHPGVDADAVVLGLPGGFEARLEPGMRAGFGYDGTTGTWNAAVSPRPGSIDVTEATVSIEHDDTGAPDVIIGPPDDTRLIVRDLGARLHLRQTGEPSVELVARAKGFGVVLTNRWFRSLGESLSTLREGVRLDADIEARLAEAGGLSVAADGVLEFRKMSGKSLSLKAFKLTIHSYVVRVVLRADTDDLDARVEVRPHWSATLGPVTLVMDGAGGWLGWWADQPGDEKHCVGLLPPTGIGLQLQIKGVTAGGFLDFTGGPTERYGGVVYVAVKPSSLRGVTITAFGLHELAGVPTDDRRDRTLIVVMGITFSPGVVFGPGIIWFGAGGLFGHDRRADTDALRERLTSGAVGNLLFADDPVRNAPLLLGDLRAIFPPKAGVHVFGLTAQFGWVPLFDDYFVRLALGLIFEYKDGGITKVVVLGSVRIRPPKLEKVLDIQIDAIGVIDVGRQTVEIDVTIRRGLALGVFKITGDGGLRASWGAQKYLAATLGGFHPDFNPAPAVFPKLRRVLLTFYKEDLPGPIDELSASGYLAVTTNTLQAGLELKAAIKSGNWKIEGTIGGDALIRMPFSFDISLHGGVHVKYRGRNLIGVSFKGGISGPSPITLRGEVCVSLLLFDACWGDSIELGSGDDVAGPALTSLVPVLAGELSLTSNVLVTAPEDDLVLLTRRETNGRSVLSPLGGPTWTQNRVPLGFAIGTFESGTLDDPQRLEVFASRPSTPFRDLFSPGSFVELSESEAMALPAFEEHPSGVVITAEVTRSAGVTIAAEVEEIRLPERRRRTPIFEIPGFVLERAESTSTPTSVPPRPGRFSVAREPFNVVGPAGAAQATGLSAVQARLESRASGGAVQHRADVLVVI